jgi:urease accessory protein
LLTATSIARAGEWATSRETARVVLDFDRRYRRRLRLSTSEGVEVLLNLAEAVHIRDGDALVLEDGGFIAVSAAEETLLEIRAADADALTRLAWHLGNRHLSVQFLPGRLRILDDHVIAEMVKLLGGTAEKISAPFDPEPGAYHG